MTRDYLLESTNWGANTISGRAVGRAVRRGLRLLWIGVDTIVATLRLA